MLIDARFVTKAMSDTAPGELVRIADDGITVTGVVLPQSDDMRLHGAFPLAVLTWSGREGDREPVFYGQEYQFVVSFGSQWLLEILDSDVVVGDETGRKAGAIAVTDGRYRLVSPIRRGSATTGWSYFDLSEMSYASAPARDRTAYGTRWRAWGKPDERSHRLAEPIVTISAA